MKKVKDFTVDEKRIYWVWGDMVSRCTCQNHPSYKNYGGRGITVSDEWRDSRNFFRDMAPRPAGMHLDRIDNSKGYSKENCHWVTRLQNNKNKRVYRASKTGISGVTPRVKAFRAVLRHKGKVVLLQDFRDFFEACCARKSAENIFVKPYLRHVSAVQAKF